MRTLNFVIFLSVFFTLYGLVNAYIFVRGLQALPSVSPMRNPYILLFWFVAFSFIGGRLLERWWPSLLSDIMVWTGSFWIAAMLYFFLAVLLLDILRAINHFFPIFPAFVTTQYVEAKILTSAVVVGIVALVLIAGHINALLPRITKRTVTIQKKVDGIQSLNVVVASDIHLGTIVGRRRFDRMVEMINSLNPDVVLLPGDIVDEDLDPVIRQNVGESLKKLKSNYGIFAITGNHEYIGGVERACRYLSEHNVTVLRDAMVRIDGGIYLVGREDRSFNHRGAQRRKSLAELMSGIDKTYPIIVMDHQPFGLAEAVQQGADLQLSGHTHHGQLWPVNYIIKAIYELGWGYRRIGQTDFYVSNGVGTWGPPVRVGNRPEIVNLRLVFSPDHAGKFLQPPAETMHSAGRPIHASIW